MSAIEIGLFTVLYLVFSYAQRRFRLGAVWKGSLVAAILFQWENSCGSHRG